jgi:hypothetical protein
MKHRNTGTYRRVSKCETLRYLLRIASLCASRAKPLRSTIADLKITVEEFR